MQLKSLAVLLFFGLLPGAFAQEAAKNHGDAAATGRSQEPGRDPLKPSNKTHDPAQIPLVDRDVKGPAGRDIRLQVFTNVRPDCTSGPLPTIRLIAPPANGKIVVRRGNFKATNVRQCLAIEVPALIAIYRSADDFEGSDSAVMEVRPFEGKPELRRFTIGVTKVDTQRRGI